MFEQMYRASMFYGRKGLPVAVISVIDLAIWDLLGHIRNEPVYKMLGGATRERLNFYCTGPEPAAAKEMGFFGAKVPLPSALVRVLRVSRRMSSSSPSTVKASDQISLSWLTAT